MSPKIEKGLDYDMHTDSCFDAPECGLCRTPLVIREEDIGKSVKCPYCNEFIHVQDEPWLREYIKNNTGKRKKKLSA